MFTLLNFSGLHIFFLFLYRSARDGQFITQVRFEVQLRASFETIRLSVSILDREFVLLIALSEASCNVDCRSLGLLVLRSSRSHPQKSGTYGACSKHSRFHSVPPLKEMFL